MEIIRDTACTEVCFSDKLKKIIPQKKAIRTLHLFPETGYRDVELLAVFGYGTTGNIIALVV